MLRPDRQRALRRLIYHLAIPVDIHMVLTWWYAICLIIPFLPNVAPHRAHLFQVIASVLSTILIANAILYVYLYITRKQK